MAANTFFERPDSHHGLAKRIILYRYLQQEFAVALNTSLRCRKYDLTYFDAFSGCGRYSSLNGEEDDEDEEGISECPFVNQLIGSPLVALEALYKHFTEQNLSRSYEKTALFVFEEKKAELFERLCKNVVDFLQEKNSGGEYVHQNGVLDWEYRKPLSSGETISSKLKSIYANAFIWEIKREDCQNTLFLKVKIILCCSSFKDFFIEGLARNTPMISFFDPFGFSHTPMKKVLQLVGIRRKIILNFMVQHIHRFGNTQNNKDNLNELFGSENWRVSLPNNLQALEVPEKMKAYLNIYKANASKCYDQMAQRTAPLKFLSFSMRRGSKAGPDKGFIYYLLFAATDLTGMYYAKYAMRVAAEEDKQGSSELYYSDYNYNQYLPWRPVTEKEVEAEYIYKHWRGKKCTFGELKEWILLWSPYCIHSNALRWLEKLGYLTVISSEYILHPDNKLCDARKYKPFPTDVGVEKNDPDPNENKKYRNGWQLQFGDEDFEKDAETPSMKSPKAGAKNKSGSIDTAIRALAL